MLLARERGELHPLVRAPDADDRSRHAGLLEHPGDRVAPQRPPARTGLCAVGVDLVAASGQPRAPAEVVRLECVDGEVVGQEAARERRLAEKPDPVLAHEAEHLRVVGPGQEAQLLLTRRHRRERVRTRDQLDRVVGKPAPANLSFLDQPLDLAPRVLNWRRRVDVVDLQGST